MVSKSLFYSLVAVVTIAVLHVLAIEHSWYWRIWWFDIPLHFLGGVVLGGTAVWGIRIPFVRSMFAFSRFEMILVLAFVLLLGAGWEVLEYVLGLTYNAIGNYPLDVCKDLVLDVLGGWFVFRLSPMSKTVTKPYAAA